MSEPTTKPLVAYVSLLCKPVFTLTRQKPSSWNFFAPTQKETRTGIRWQELHHVLKENGLDWGVKGETMISSQSMGDDRVIDFVSQVATRAIALNRKGPSDKPFVGSHVWVSRAPQLNEQIKKATPRDVALANRGKTGQEILSSVLGQNKSSSDEALYLIIPINLAYVKLKPENDAAIKWMDKLWRSLTRMLFRYQQTAERGTDNEMLHVDWYGMSMIDGPASHVELSMGFEESPFEFNEGDVLLDYLLALQNNKESRYASALDHEKNITTKAEEESNELGYLASLVKNQLDQFSASTPVTTATSESTPGAQSTSSIDPEPLLTETPLTDHRTEDQPLDTDTSHEEDIQNMMELGYQKARGVVYVTVDCPVVFLMADHSTRTNRRFTLTEWMRHVMEEEGLSHRDFNRKRDRMVMLVKSLLSEVYQRVGDSFPIEQDIKLLELSTETHRTSDQEVYLLVRVILKLTTDYYNQTTKKSVVHVLDNHTQRHLTSLVRRLLLPEAILVDNTLTIAPSRVSYQTNRGYWMPKPLIEQTMSTRLQPGMAAYFDLVASSEMKVQLPYERNQNISVASKGLFARVYDGVSSLVFDPLSRKLSSAETLIVFAYLFVTTDAWKELNRDIVAATGTGNHFLSHEAYAVWQRNKTAYFNRVKQDIVAIHTLHKTIAQTQQYEDLYKLLPSLLSFVRLLKRWLSVKSGDHELEGCHATLFFYSQRCVTLTKAEQAAQILGSIENELARETLRYSFAVCDKMNQKTDPGATCTTEQKTAMIDPLLHYRYAQ